MTECDCLSAKYEFAIYKRNHPKNWFQRKFWGETNQFPTRREIIVISGNSMEEIVKKKNQVRAEFESKYIKDDYEINVWTTR